MINIIPFSLFEKNLSFVTPTEIITKEFIELQDQKGFLAPYAVQYNWEEHQKNLDMDDDEEVYKVTQSEDFNSWLEYELKNRFDNLKDLFGSLGNQILLYREMTVESDYLQKMKDGKVKRIGRYWTYDKDSAESHWGHNKGKESTIIFESTIKQEYIDWIETFRLNLEHEFMNEEKEIRLFKNTKLDISSITWNGKDIPSIELDVINKHEYIA